MAFFKFRSRGPQANEGRNASVAAAPAESVEAMRRRARHRLLGAAVLVLIGVIGFPLLFDTQPRPVSVDIPIEIPDRSKTKPLALPPTPAPATTTTPSTGASTAATAPSGGSMITESADGAEIPPSRPAPAAPPAETKPAAPVAEARPEPKPESKPEPKPEPKPKPEPEAKPEARAEAKPEKPTPAKPADDGNRARALLEGKAAAAAAAKPAVAADESGRFVVQVGAFADADKAREVRQRLEKAGLKTYTSVAKTAGGERTRVRVGPFGTRAEADKAASRVKGLSLSASVLSL
jgi:DedD protein